jgi:K+-transporting ATPase ATPase C chain
MMFSHSVDLRVLYILFLLNINFWYRSSILNFEIQSLNKDNPHIQKGQIPTQMVTASGSGLDPHISPESALVQVERIAQQRKASADQITALIQEHSEGPQLGIFGDPVVNVLPLNLHLDKKYPLSR